MATVRPPSREPGSAQCTEGMLNVAVRLRVAYWQATPAAPSAGDAASSGANGPGTIVLVVGRGEFFEVYAETIADLTGRGWAVITYDHRGQGGSERRARRGGHIGSFSAYADDLVEIVRFAAQVGLPRPFHLLGHSMGGLVALRAAERLAGEVERMVLVGPMLELARLPGSPTLIAAASTALTLIGFGRRPITKVGRPSTPFDGNRLTSDPVRYAGLCTAADANPHLMTGPPTIGWVRAAFAAMAQAARTAGAPLAIPTLFIASGNDTVVSTPAIDRFARVAPGGGVVIIPGARHHLLLERDQLRNLFFAALDAFLVDVPLRLTSVRPARFARPLRFEPTAPAGSDRDAALIHRGDGQRVATRIGDRPALTATVPDLRQGEAADIAAARQPRPVPSLRDADAPTAIEPRRMLRGADTRPSPEEPAAAAPRKGRLGRRRPAASGELQPVGKSGQPATAPPVAAADELAATRVPAPAKSRRGAGRLRRARNAAEHPGGADAGSGTPLPLAGRNAAAPASGRPKGEIAFANPDSEPPADAAGAGSERLRQRLRRRSDRNVDAVASFFARRGPGRSDPADGSVDRDPASGMTATHPADAGTGAAQHAAPSAAEPVSDAPPEPPARHRRQPRTEADRPSAVAEPSADDGTPAVQHALQAPHPTAPVTPSRLSVDGTPDDAAAVAVRPADAAAVGAPPASPSPSDDDGQTRPRGGFIFAALPTAARRPRGDGRSSSRRR